MSSLWTPDGERRVEPEDPNAADGLDAETEARYRAELADLERQLLAAPVADVIANHCYGLFQLAALHLGQKPPNVTDAQLAIDALGAVVDTLGDRLGTSAATLGEGLAQIRLAYVEISTGVPGEEGAEEQS